MGALNLVEEEELALESIDCITSSSQKLFSQVTATLESLYSSGMSGWGKDHGGKITAAIEGTGLTLTLIKVCYN